MPGVDGHDQLRHGGPSVLIGMQIHRRQRRRQIRRKKVLSQPVSAISWGMEIPLRCKCRITPKATKSLMATMAVGWIASPYDGNSWWTGGFWPGLMWQLYAATKDIFFLEEARRTEKLLVDEFRTFHALNHDVGFMYLLSCWADAKLTGNEQAHTDTLHAASLLMGRFNPAGYIRAWNGENQAGFAIIDCMMNLSLLFWASRETGDPRFAHVAKIHAAGRFLFCFGAFKSSINEKACRTTP